MKKIKQFAIFWFLNFIWRVQCFQPNCVPKNQFKFFKFPVEACSKNFPEICKLHNSGYFQALGDASVLKIGKTRTLPTCAFANSIEVTHIYGVNSGIEILATRSFLNLPNLKSLHLEFNSIREVRHSVFKNVSLELLDLSWNKIVFLDHHAFTYLVGLKFLNLSRNSLVTVPLYSLSQTIIELNLSHNLLNSLLLTSSQFSNLTTVDFSNNMIEKVAISFEYPLEQIDLTYNRLTKLDYIDISSVKLFKIGGNMFETVPEYLENLNANIINIYPNPWNCGELPQLWIQLVGYNIRLSASDAKAEMSTAAICGDKARPIALSFLERCIDDHECSDNMICRTAKCLDPCKESACPVSSICQTNNHRFTCTCPEGFHRDPLDFYASCKNVECYSKAHCDDMMICWNESCIQYYSLPTTRPLFTTTVTSRSTVTPLIDSEPPGELFNMNQPVIPDALPWWYDDIPNMKPQQKDVVVDTDTF